MKITAPFTEEQVEELNLWQELGFVHEFTCPNDHEGNRVLVATTAGWICPTCDYTQDWAHSFMANSKRALKEHEELIAKLKKRVYKKR